MRRNSQLRKTLFGAAMLLLFMASSGYGQSLKQAKKFDIPSQSLLQALTRFSVQSDIQFMSSNPRISIMTSRKVFGVYTPENALKIILADSGFSFEFTNRNTVRIFRMAPVGHDAETQNLQKQVETAEMSADEWIVSAVGSEDNDRSIFEEIIITARKREENPLNIPIAVTVLGRINLERRGVENISTISDIVPNVSFSSGGTSSGSGSAAVIYIRGVGQNDFTPVTDPGVGIYVDGIYLGRTIGAVLDIVDLERLEVLRGPQGTLFGRNTIGGAINLITREPTDETGGRIKLTTGQDDLYSVSANLDLPIAKRLSMTVAGLFRKREGYVKRPLVGDALGDEDTYGGRLKLLFRPTESLTLKMSLEGTRERENSAPEVATDIKENAPFIENFNNSVGNGECIGGGDFNNPACANDQYIGQPFISYETGPSQNDIDTWAVALTAEQKISDHLTVKSLTSYREIDAFFSRSSDGTPFTIFQTTDDYHQTQFTEEVQFIGTSLHGRLEWVGGLFYMTEQASNLSFLESDLSSFPRLIGGEAQNDNFAVFAESTFAVTDKLHITGGLRYTFEDKRFLPTSIIVGDDVPVVPPVKKNLSFNELTWRSSLTYKISHQMTTYLTLSKGFKSGGFVQRLTQPVSDLPTFEPEYVTLYEAGLKMEFPEHFLRLNLAAFYSDYDSIQVAANPAGQFNTVTANAAQGSIAGGEAEFTWQPIKKMLLEGGVGYQDARYNEIGDIGVTVDRNDAFIRTPEWSIMMGITYQFDIGEYGSLSPRFDWAYKSSIQFEPDNDPSVAQDGYHMVDFRITYADPADKFHVNFGIENLTNEKYLLSGDSNNVIGYSLVMFARPRNWFLDLSFSF